MGNKQPVKKTPNDPLFLFNRKLIHHVAFGYASRSNQQKLKTTISTRLSSKDKTLPKKTTLIRGQVDARWPLADISRTIRSTARSASDLEISTQ
jgi:hypothetical protein